MLEFGHPVTLWDHFNIAMIRDFPEWQETAPELDGIYLHLSHGRKHIVSPPGARWVHYDFPEWDANRGQIPENNESVSGIFTSHAMDHYARPIWFLSEVQRVLKTGGWFVNVAGHYTSELAHNCFEHRTRFAIDVWKNAFSDHYYDQKGAVDGDSGMGWKFEIGFNMIMGLKENNVVLVTQLIKTDYVVEYK
jgi:hypothetical protein